MPAAALLAMLALAAGYLALRNDGLLEFLHGAALREWVVNLGLWGPLAIVGLMAAAVLISPIPSAPIAMAAGAAYGHLWGTVYVLTGAELGAIAAFSLARVVGHAPLKRHFGERLETGLVGSQVALMGIVFVSRLVPFISFDLISYAAGLTVLSFWRFALATLAGIVPASFLLAHFGLELSGGDGEQLLYTALALGLITAIPVGWALIRDFRRRRSR